jgi:hypothetical protein
MAVSVLVTVLEATVSAGAAPPVESCFSWWPPPLPVFAAELVIVVVVVVVVVVVGGQQNLALIAKLRRDSEIHSYLYAGDR